MEEKHKTFHRKKTFTAFLICLAAFLGLAGRLVYLMVYSSAYYSDAADSLHQRKRSIKAKRGRILDAAGNVLADNRTVCTVSVIHNQITDPDAVVEVLARELKLRKIMSSACGKIFPPSNGSKATWIRKQAMRSAPVGFPE